MKIRMLVAIASCACIGLVVHQVVAAENGTPVIVKNKVSSGCAKSLNSSNGDACTFYYRTDTYCVGNAESDCVKGSVNSSSTAGVCSVTFLAGTWHYDCK